MATVRQSNAAAPPEGCLEFLLMLSRIEACVRNADASAILEEGISESDYASIWRGKVVAYEQSLLEHLACWKDVDEASAERYRTRIEELGPTLQHALDARTSHQAAASSSAAASAVATSHVPAAGVARALAARETAAQAERAKAEAAAAEAAEMTRDTEAEGASDVGLRAEEARPDAAAVTSTPSELKRPAEVAWRQPGRKPVSSASQRGQYEDEMLQITDNMKGLAQSWTRNLQRDAKVLDEIQNSQDVSQSKVEKANKTGKAMLWTGSLSFFKTMMMLAVSVVIFFMLIPFIIIT